MRFALIAALLAAPCVAAPALTKIEDTLYKADGGRFDGVAQIEWKSFHAADGSEIPQQALHVKIIGGALRVSLVPTANAPKPITYVVKFNSDGRIQFVEYWLVPPSATPLRLKDVRTQQQAGGITSGQATISDITGLRAELDVRPARGTGYAASRAAVINSSGALDAVIGNAADCVRVDGTSGPCGTGGLLFIDGELPAGATNGLNNTFALSAPPTPAASLNLFRNGVLLRQGADYTLSGSIITMSLGSIPTAGDVLQAWYRLASGGTETTRFSENETPAGLVDGSNATFTLQTAPVPASGLQLFRSGLLQKVGLDYTLSVNIITFSPGAIPNPGDVLQVSYRH